MQMISISMNLDITINFDDIITFIDLESQKNHTFSPFFL